MGITNDKIIAERCCNALSKNKKYMKMQHENIESDIINAYAENICYKTGYNDAKNKLCVAQKCSPFGVIANILVAFSAIYCLYKNIKINKN